MLTENSEARLLLLLVLEGLPGSCTRGQLREILIASGEIDQLQVDSLMGSLLENGSIAEREGAFSNAKYDASAAASREKAIVITDMGRAVAASLADKREFYLPAINRAIRCYKKIMYGADYRINSEKTPDGVRVFFSLYMGDSCIFDTSLFFSSAREAAAVRARMEADPDAFYRGFMTVATGEIDYLK